MTSLPRLGAPLDWLNFFLADVRDGLGPYSNAGAPAG